LNISSKYLFLILSIITVASVLYNCKISCVHMMKVIQKYLFIFTEHKIWS
jgi:hypothetical protein